ncbi:hypothetical protein [Hydromonas duriensis]|nr:hypothetical protein [Hydromonas duriensis]
MSHKNMKAKVKNIICDLVKLIAILLVGLIILWLVYKYGWLNKSRAFEFPSSSAERGQFGDFFGGVFNPIIGLFSAYFVYRAFKAQIDANEKIREQFQIEHLEAGIASLYGFLEKNIESFSFKSLPPSYLKTKEEMDEILSSPKYRYSSARNEDKIEAYNCDTLEDIESSEGGAAIHKLICQIICEPHASESELQDEDSVQQLINILETFLELLIRIKDCENKMSSKNTEHKHAYRLLLESLFKYQIAKNHSDYDLCSHQHGLPEKLSNTFSSIQDELRIARSNKIVPNVENT